MVETGTLDGQAWQMALWGNMECLEYLHTSGEYSDLDIIFPDGVCIKAHRLILSMKSPVFGARLMGPMATSKQLNLSEDHNEIFQKLLDHTYLDRMDLESVEEALEVYALAHKYLMEHARKTCLQYILSNLTEETMLAALETSAVHGDKELKDKCIEMLSRDPDAVMSSETVSHLSKETLRNLLKSDDICFSSETVPFKGLIAWGRAQLGPEEEPSGSAVRQKIGNDLLKEVRFLNMSCDEFVDNVFGTDVLTHTECFHILWAIRGADLSTLPEDTPLNPTRRGRMAPKLRERRELSSCALDLAGFGKDYTSSSEVVLLEGLSSDATIQLHHIDVKCYEETSTFGGALNIMDEEGKTISSAVSEGGNFTFTRPAVLQKDKKYKVVFYPKEYVRLHRGHSGGSRRAGNATLSFSRGHNCCFYIWEPTSN